MTVFHRNEKRGDLPAGLKGGVIAIGDGMPTDVRGAEAFGLDVLYISGGIHAQDYVEGGRTDEAKLEAFLKREGAHPKWWMPRLQ